MFGLARARQVVVLAGEKDDLARYAEVLQRAEPLHAALEFFSVPGGAARVGEEDGPSAGGIHLELVVPIEAVHARGPAMNRQNHRVFLAGFPAERLHQKAVDVPTVSALERHALDR